MNRKTSEGRAKVFHLLLLILDWLVCFNSFGFVHWAWFMSIKVPRR